MFASKHSGMYSTFYPIDTSIEFSGKENNVFGPSYPKLKEFDDFNASTACVLLMPVDSNSYLLSQDLSSTKNNINSVIKFS